MSPASDFPSACAVIAAWWRMVEVCLPSRENCGAVTFSPSGAATLDADWDAWVSGLYVPVLKPSLCALQIAAASQSLNAMLRAEHDLAQALPESAVCASLAAGRCALLDFVPPRGARLLERMRQAAVDSDATGHLPAVFAARAHVFHLPSVQVAGAYLLAECVLGAGDAGTALPDARVAAMVRRGLAGCSSVPAPLVAAA